MNRRLDSILTTWLDYWRSFSVWWTGKHCDYHWAQPWSDQAQTGSQISAWKAGLEEEDCSATPEECAAFQKATPEFLASVCIRIQDLPSPVELDSELLESFQFIQKQFGCIEFVCEANFSNASFHNAQLIFSKASFLNIGHFIDHMLMLIFAKAVARVWLLVWQKMVLCRMILWIFPSSACAYSGSFGGPLASQRDDSRFFVGIRPRRCRITNNPLQMAFGLAAIGVFAAIYHPVGIAMVIEGEGNVGWRLGLNGVWGNRGCWCTFGDGVYFGRIRLAACFHHSDPFDPYRFGVSGLMLKGKAESPEAALRKKASASHRAEAGKASLAMVTAAGGFVFGVMTFPVSFWSQNAGCFNWHCRYRSSRRSGVCGGSARSWTLDWPYKPILIFVAAGSLFF